MSGSLSYKTLCSFSVFHEYYNSTICSDDMTLHINLANRKICRNEGITLKLTDYGVSILYEKSETWQDTDDDVRICFGISFNQPDFFSFTTGGLNQIDRVLLCSNETTRTANDFETDLQYLHDGNFVDGTHMKFAKELGSSGIMRGVPLIVELNLKTLIAQVYDDTSEVSAPITRYVVRFAAREAPWLYWFWLKQGKLKNLIEAEGDFDRLDVHLQEESLADNELSFKQLDYVISNNNQTGVRFISSVPVKLGACSDFKLSLSCQSDMGNKILVEQLPHPAKDCLELLRVGDSNQVVASSHVSL